jgi:uncharacterized membrane-anchored protein
MRYIIMTALLFAFMFTSSANAEEYEVGVNLATLSIDNTLSFLNAEETRSLIRDNGYVPSGTEAGIVYPVAENENWHVIIDYYPSGFVKDNIVNQLDYDYILRKVQEGVQKDETFNMVVQGHSPLKIVDWYDKPFYDDEKHSLMWSYRVQEEHREGELANAIVLGRDGFMWLTLIAPIDEANKVKTKFQQIVANLSWVEGKKYENYIVNQDKPSPHDLTDLLTWDIYDGVNDSFQEFIKFMIISMIGIVIFVIIFVKIRRKLRRTRY